MKIEFEVDIKAVIHYVIAGFANFVTFLIFLAIGAAFSSPVTLLIYIIVSGVPYAVVREKLENFFNSLIDD